MPLPYLTNQAPWFSFLVHPRDAGDLLRASLGSTLRHYSRDEADFLEKMSSPPPVVGGDIRFGFAPIRGELVVAMCLSHEITAKKGQQAVIAAAKMAASRGSRVLGLGALTAPATGGGQLLLRHLPEGVTVTTGNAYTAAVIYMNVLDGCSLLARDTSRIAVVGCTGSVGVSLSRVLADAGFDLLLIARSAARAKVLLGGLSGKAVFSEDIADVRGANVIVLLTSDPSAKLSPELVCPGAIVIDVCQPPNVAAEDSAKFRQRGIGVARGGIVRIPDYRCTYDLNLPEPADTFACLAETYLFAREGIRDHSLGRPTPEVVALMGRLAEKHGITARPIDVDLQASRTFGVGRIMGA
jgi:fatty aldehyde-generating acyl-ACP reductase